jgi:hypothetical protein
VTAVAGGLAKIDSMVASAIGVYEYRRRERDFALFRQRKDGGPPERLVDGRWTPLPERFADGNGFKALDAEKLALHVRQYLLGDLDGPPVSLREGLKERFRRTRFWLRLNPPLKGGASRRLAEGTAERSRKAYSELLEDVAGVELAELKEQALLGYEQQRQRGAGTEQRANFFLAASGLTTSLVLANASLLLGASKLNSPLRELAALALGAASACAIAAGLRAMQAMMISFFRAPPNGVDRVFDRRAARGDSLTRLYVAALLVAQGRAGAIGDWKVNRLRDARRWFVGAILGVVLLTSFVLVEAL